MARPVALHRDDIHGSRRRVHRAVSPRHCDEHSRLGSGSAVRSFDAAWRIVLRGLRPHNSPQGSLIQHYSSGHYRSCNAVERISLLCVSRGSVLLTTAVKFRSDTSVLVLRSSLCHFSNVSSLDSHNASCSLILAPRPSAVNLAARTAKPGFSRRDRRGEVDDGAARCVAVGVTPLFRDPLGDRCGAR